MPKKTTKKKPTRKQTLARIEKEILSAKKEEFEEMKKIEKGETRIETELSEFEKELEDLKKSSKPKVIERFTSKDIARGIVGAIFGMSIMAWHEVVIENAMHMSWLNVVLIISLTIIAGTSVLYFSQYRKIKEKWIIHLILPKRFTVFYLLSMVVVAAAYYLIGVIDPGVTTVDEAVKLVLVVSLPAMIGASAADIIRI